MEWIRAESGMDLERERECEREYEREVEDGLSGAGTEVKQEWSEGRETKNWVRRRGVEVGDGLELGP